MRTMLCACLLLVPSLASSCALFCPPEETAPAVQGNQGFGPTPGNNCSVSITPTTPGQPTMWAAWNFTGNATIGSPTYHTVFVGSDDSNIIVGGATATQGVSYLLVIQDLTGSSPSATLKTAANDPGTSVAVTSIEAGSESFAVEIRDTNPVSANLLMVITAPGGGVKITLSK